jgi:hypothetical protein
MKQVNTASKVDAILKDSENVQPETLTSEQRQIIGNNRIKAYTQRAIYNLCEQLHQYVGKKVFLASGNRSAKFNVQLMDVPFIPNLGQSYRSHIQNRYNQLYLFNDITLCDQKYAGGGYGVSYYKKDVSVAEISNNGILLRVYDPEKIISDWRLNEFGNPDEVAELKKQRAELSDKLRAIEHKLSILGIN